MAVGGRLLWGRNEVNPLYFDLPQFTQPFGSKSANLVAGVLARWDAVWYVLLAQNGYAGPGGLPSPDGPDQWGASVGFWPGYPALVRVASGFASSRAVVLIAAYAVALVAYGIALYLFQRLTELELGRQNATWAVVLLAVFPGALFLGIPYTESLFLVLSIGSFWAARTGRWPLACALGGGCALTRLPGVILIVPLALFYLYGPSGREPRRPLRSDAAWLLLVLAGAAAFPLYAWHLTGDPAGAFHVSSYFDRSLADPFSAFWSSTKAAADGFGVIFLSARPGADGTAAAIIDLTRYLALLGAVPVTAEVWRRLGPTYGSYCVVTLFVILCTGPARHPLMNALRYLAVLFPLFMVLAPWLRERRAAGVAFLTVSIVSLAAVTVQFARWWYVG